MAWTMTPWGYEVDGDVPPLITSEDLDEITGGKLAADARIPQAIAACASAVRKACGWHVAGPATCRATFDGGMARVWLPANHVLSVTSVEVVGEPTDAFEWNRMGLLRLPRTPDRLRAVVVEYVAGHAEVPPDLATLVADRVRQMLSESRGVAQETAGSVSVSYAQSVAADRGGVYLSRADRDALAGYRLVEAV